MAEPVTLYKGNKELTTAAPSEVKRLLAEGWTLDKPKAELKPEPVPATPKPGRKPKAKNA